MHERLCCRYCANMQIGYECVNNALVSYARIYIRRTLWCPLTPVKTIKWLSTWCIQDFNYILLYNIYFAWKDYYVVFIQLRFTIFYRCALCKLCLFLFLFFASGLCCVGFVDWNEWHSLGPRGWCGSWLPKQFDLWLNRVASRARARRVNKARALVKYTRKSINLASLNLQVISAI